MRIKSPRNIVAFANFRHPSTSTFNCVRLYKSQGWSFYKEIFPQ